MAKLRALVAAAGRGTRAGLAYPKTLFPIQGKPILVRIFELLAPYDNNPTLIVSPAGESPIRQCLVDNALTASLVLQPEPRGMGDAVLRFTESPAFDGAEHLLLIWGDIPFIQPETVDAIVSAHEIQENDLTFATRLVDAAYTVVTRGASGEVFRVTETREDGVGQLQAGERDIGLFVFRKAMVLNLLREDLAGKFGKTTGEHGFLYIIGHLVARGHRVMALPIANDLDLISLNSMKDIDAYL
jgi:bifunctional UDP-N-acetylglucosamine pyrophosphorylase/glucosamine-1-phosphate N-acetyltransferase